MITTLLYVILVLVVVGILLWGIKAAPVIDETIKQFLRIAIIVVTAIWLVYVVGTMLGLTMPPNR